MLSYETAPSTRLVDQYARITADSERYQRVERIRFLRDLLSRVREHGDQITVARCGGGYTDWQIEFLRRRACRQGVDIGTSFAFILEHIRNTVGPVALSADLQATGCELGRAIGRRLAIEGVTSFAGDLAAVRICDTVAATSEEHNLTPVSVGASLHARCDVSEPSAANGDWYRGLRLAVAVDNPGSRTIHAVGVEVRVMIQTEVSRRLLRTGLCAFGVIPSIPSGRRAWLALRGFEPELAGEAAEASGRVIALRYLIQRV